MFFLLRFVGFVNFVVNKRYKDSFAHLLSAQRTGLKAFFSVPSPVRINFIAAYRIFVKNKAPFQG
jgi:hypothetical protein